MSSDQRRLCENGQAHGYKVKKQIKFFITEVLMEYQKLSKYDTLMLNFGCLGLMVTEPVEVQNQ